MEPLFDVPNLDGLKLRELKEAARVLGKLADYARLKARATEMRLGGDRDMALIGAIEEQCDAIYGGLPEWARW